VVRHTKNTLVALQFVQGDERMKSGLPCRLLLVVDSLDVGGAERHVVDLACALADRGTHVTVACSVAGVLETRLIAHGIPVRPVVDRLVKRRASARYAAALGELLAEDQFDLVHAHIHASEIAAAAATADTGVALVLTEHTEGPWRRRADHRAAASAFARAARVVAVSEPVRRMLIHRYGLSPDRISLIYPGVLPPPSDAASRVAVPTPGGEGPLIGFAGRLVASKGVDVLLHAATLLSVPARLLIIGDGPERIALEQMAHRLGLGGRICFAGFRSDVRALLPALDLLVVPSRTDGSPLVVLEAMAAGLPVVVSAVGGLPDQITHGQQGLLVPPDDSAALAIALTRLLGDAALRVRMGAAGRRRAANFSHDAMVDALQRVYVDALCQTVGSVHRLGETLRRRVQM
jgi:glycosyltransferase involved in cell wall biosynthesis